MKKAMVMSAGVGSRLDPLTKDTPKPLVPIANEPVMDFLLKRLKSFGVESVIANTHYLAEQIEKRYSVNSPIDIDFNYIRETELSGTAGGLKKCQSFFNDGESFFVMSSDGFHNVNLAEVKNSHKMSGAIATMVLKEIEQSETHKYGVVVRDKEGFVEYFQEKPSPEEAKSNLVNTGIYVFDYEVFKHIPEATFFDFAKNLFPSLLSQGIKINTCLTDAYWNDIGTLDQYLQSTKDVFEGKINIPGVKVVNTRTGRLIAGTDCKIADDAVISGDSVIGNKVTIESSATICDSIIWDNSKIKSGAKITDSVIGYDTTVQNNLEEVIVGSFETVNEEFLCKI